MERVFESFDLERKSRADLERPSSTGTERLVDALCGLAERKRLRCRIRSLRIQVERVAGQVGDIERVEHLSQNRYLVTLLEAEYLREAEILSDGWIAELVIARENERR